MTLPQIDKPSINDSIEDIISDIKENTDYLDTRPVGMKAVFFSKDTTGASETVNITVDFQPRNILFFYIGLYGGNGYGIYNDGSSCTIREACYLSSGVFSYETSSMYNSIPLIYYVKESAIDTPNYWYGYALGKSEWPTNGFAWRWVKVSNYWPDNIYVLALCIQ